METSDVVKELQVFLNKYPKWDSCDIERVAILTRKLTSDCYDALYDMKMQELYERNLKED